MRRVRPGGWHQPSQAVFGAIAVFALLLSLTLAGCGKKGPPTPPPDEPVTYPRPYPDV